METENKKKIKDIFVDNQDVTLGVKLVGTFAIVYYGLFFIFMIYLGIFYNTVYDPSYLGKTISENNSVAVLISYITRTVLLGVIITSLIMMFCRKSSGKLIFMISTILLVFFQIYTTNPPAWSSYIIETLLVLIMAPLKVVNKFNKKIVEETQKINIKKKGKE